MSFPESLSAGSARTSADQRIAPRYALLLRAAKLIGPQGHEYLCIVRDVSETGVKLRLFHPLAGLGSRLALECSTGDRMGVDLVWEHEGEAGFRFVRPIDVQEFIAEAGPHPKRPVRLAVDRQAHLTVAGSSIDARLRNLSRQGASIETSQHLAIGQQLRISAEHLPVFEATVCWRREPFYGMVFRQLMSLEELALRVFVMQASA